VGLSEYLCLVLRDTVKSIMTPTQEDYVGEGRAFAINVSFSCVAVTHDNRE
jgi:hypothetical protein